MTNIWTPNGNRVAAMAPGPDDLFVVTTLFGKRVFIQPIADYDRALAIAEAFARQMTQPRPFAIKVIPMSPDELLAHMGTTYEKLAGGQSTDDGRTRQLIIDTCMAALRECNEAGVRADALKLLTDLGVLTTCHPPASS